VEALLRIVRRILGGSPIVLAISCTGPRVDKEPPKAEAVIEESKTIDNSDDDSPKSLGKFHITFYYVVNEDDVVAKPKPANDNVEEVDLVAVTAPPETVTIYEWKTCEPIADVTPEFASQARLQGTGMLRDGRLINIASRCECDRKPCFQVLSEKVQWGTAGTGRPLQPFRTVAVDPKVVKLGSLIHVPLLEGRTMPGRAPWGGYVHDGCLVADDTGGGIDGHQLDLFVGKRAWFHGLGKGNGGSHAWARHVPVFDGSKICERKGRKVGKKQASI
jgi:3D (Asp-Asp-Asp) domain-containing protein